MSNPDQDDSDLETGQETESRETPYLLYCYSEGEEEEKVEEEVVILENPSPTPNSNITVDEPEQEIFYDEDIPTSAVNGDSSYLIYSYPEEEEEEVIILENPSPTPNSNITVDESEPENFNEDDVPTSAVNRESFSSDNEEKQSNGEMDCPENSPDIPRPTEQVENITLEPINQPPSPRVSPRLARAIHQAVETFLTRFGIRGLIRMLLIMNAIYGRDSRPLLRRIFECINMYNRRTANRAVTPGHHEPHHIRVRATNAEITEADSTSEGFPGRTNPGQEENESHVNISSIQRSANEMAIDDLPPADTNDISKMNSNEPRTSQSSGRSVVSSSYPTTAQSSNARMYGSFGPSISYSPQTPNTHSNNQSILNSNNGVPSNGTSASRYSTNKHINELSSSQNKYSVVSSQKGKEIELPVQGINNGEESNHDIQIVDSNNHQREDLEGEASQEIPHDENSNEENEHTTWAAQFPLLEAAVQGRQIPNAALPHESPRQQRHVVRQEADSSGIPMEIEESEGNMREVVGNNFVISINDNSHRSPGRRRFGTRREISSRERRMIRVRYLTSLLRLVGSSTNRPALIQANALFSHIYPLDRDSPQLIPADSSSNSNQNNAPLNIQNIHIRRSGSSGQVINYAPFRANIVIHNAGHAHHRNTSRPLSNRPTGTRPIWARAAWERPPWVLAASPRVAYMRPSWARPPWIRPSWARAVWVRPSWALPAPGHSSSVRNVPLRATSSGATATRSASLHPSWSRLDWLRYRWTRPGANRRNDAEVRDQNSNSTPNSPFRMRNLARQEQARREDNTENRGRLWIERVRAVRHRRFRASRYPSRSRQ